MDSPKFYNKQVYDFAYQHLSASEINKLFGRRFVYEIARAFGVEKLASRRDVDEIIILAGKIRKVQ